MSERIRRKTDVTTRSRPTRGAAPRVALAMLVVLALAGLTAPAAGATGSTWKYSMVVTGDPAAGAPASFLVAIKNRSSSGTLNGADLWVPSAYAVTGATTSRGTVSVYGNLLKLRGLWLKPWKTVTVVVSTTVPCSSSGTTSTWYAANVKSQHGRSFVLDAAASARTTTVYTACYLEFLSHPQDAAPDEAIPGGEGAVSVGLFSAAGPITGGSPVDVSMSIGTNPGGGMLDGTLTQATSAGVATFADLSIDLPGEGYTLAAAATFFNPATSDPFTIAGVVVECAADEDCEASLGDGENTSAFISAPANGSSAMIVASFTDDETNGIDCDGYVESSGSTLVFDVQNTGDGDDRPKTVGFTIATDLGYPDPDDFQICYESLESPFFARGSGDTQVTLGLLLDCVEYPEDSGGDTTYNDPPCILSRSAEGSIVTLLAQLPGGDPKGRV